jgi:hypothetical protein
MRAAKDLKMMVANARGGPGIEDELTMDDSGVLDTSSSNKLLLGNYNSQRIAAALNGLSSASGKRFTLLYFLFCLSYYRCLVFQATEAAGPFYFG